MNIYDAIAARRTIRDFQDKPVQYEVVRRILSAGLSAPSNDHMRRWEFIIVDDNETRKALVKGIKRVSRSGAKVIIDRWGLEDTLQREMYLGAIPKQVNMILSAGVLIIPCFYQPEPLLKPKSLSSLNRFASIWCCIENILLAAASEGVFGVMRIPFPVESETMRTVLNIPADYEVPCYLALGYPQEGAMGAKQHTIHVDDRISINQWGNKQASMLQPEEEIR
jgi:nitroreductase